MYHFWQNNEKYLKIVFPNVLGVFLSKQTKNFRYVWLIWGNFKWAKWTKTFNKKNNLKYSGTVEEDLDIGSESPELKNSTLRIQQPVGFTIYY